MIKRPYALKAQVASSASINEQDTLAIKSALSKTGDYEIPDYGITPYADESMIQGITKFQKKNNLKIDGIMNPGGETEQALFGKKPRNNLTQSRQKPKPNKPQGLIINEIPSKKPTWWDLLLKDHKIPDVVHSANDRAVGVLKNHADAGEHPTWIAQDMNQAVKDGSENRAKGHMASLADILQKLNEIEPSKADDYLGRFFDQLSTSAKSYFSQFTASENQDQTENDNDDEVNKVQRGETRETSNEDEADETNVTIEQNDGYIKDGFFYYTDSSKNPKGLFRKVKMPNMVPQATIDGNQQNYRVANIVLNNKVGATPCYFFAAAHEVTAVNAVGGADWGLAGYIRKDINPIGAINDEPMIKKDEIDKYLIATHHGLAELNYDVYNHLSNGKDYPTLEGLTGKELDYALVELEQNKLEELTDQYFKDNPDVDRDEVMKQISEDTLSGYNKAFGNGYVNEAIERLPEGVEYDFNNKEHRIMIGKAIIDIFYEENE